MKIMNIFREGKRALVTTLLLSGVFSFSAWAAGNYSVDSDPIIFHVTHDSAAPEAETFTVKLRAAEDGVPMPEVTEMQITAEPGQRVEITDTFGGIHFTSPDVYSYIMYAEAGNTPNLSYDETEYLISFEVLNAGEDAEDGLKIGAITCAVGDTKYPDPGFTDKYNTPETTPEETTAPNNGGGGSGGGSGGGGSNRPGGGAVTPSTPNADGPGTVIGEVLGAVRDAADGVESVLENIPQVLGASRDAIATGDSSLMAVYGMGALLACLMLGGWCYANRKKKNG